MSGRALSVGVTATALFATALAPLPAVSEESPAPITFEDRTEPAGIRFQHHHGGRGDKHLPETMGSGVVWLDYDRDGRWDLYFVDSGPVPGTRPGASSEESITDGSGSTDRVRWQDEEDRPPGHDVLYRSTGPTSFDAAPASGAVDPAFGVGAAAGDFDNDGFTDLLVTNWGPNTLYRNNGDGSFSRVGDAAGVDHPRLSASAAWGDLDLDGYLDLYVATYVDYDIDDAPYCGDRERGIRDYCHPRLFDGQPDLLYHNRGDGTFADISAKAGVENPLESKGLGVVIGDVDENGYPDIYVANDTTRNFLYLNRGDLTFEDAAVMMGVAFGENGEPQAGMGLDLGDMDGDANLEIVVTNFAFEPYNLYRLYGGAAFLDDSYSLGLGEASYAFLGFGVDMTDLDGDGDLDLAIANGHILDHVNEFEHNTTYPQPNQILVNRLVQLRRRAIEEGRVPELSASTPSGTVGGTRDEGADDGPPVRWPQSDWRPRTGMLTEGSDAAGESITRKRVSRGLAVADADHDGDPDLAVSNSRGPGELQINTTDGGAGRAVLRLRGRASNRDAVGARVWVTPIENGPDGTARPGFPQMFELKSSSSYCSQNAADLYAGLGAAAAARVTVRWPDGTVEEVGRVAAGEVSLVVEGRGLVASNPLSRTP